MLLKSILPLAYLATTFAQQPYLNIDDQGNFVDSSDSKWIDGLTLNKVLNRAEKLPDTANEIEFEKGPKGLLRSSAGNEAAVQLRKFRYQFIMAFWVRYHGNLDKLSQKWEDFKSRITNYGCFCFNESNAAGGKGQARDLIDQSCKNLFKCQTCIKMDIDNRNILPNTDGSCSITTTYNFNLTKSAVTELPEIECQNLEGTCKRALCECDKRFANELAHSYDTWDSQWKGKDSFDRNSVCKSVGNAVKGQIDQCCGVYPFRYPYHSQNGNRKCCGVKTYDVNGPKTCCRDMVLRDECPQKEGYF